MYQVPIFMGEKKKFLNREKCKKKKSLKRSHKSCFWHFRKTAKKVHNKEYIYISISTHRLYIYTHSGITRETEEGLGGRGQMG